MAKSSDGFEFRIGSLLILNSRYSPPICFQTLYFPSIDIHFNVQHGGIFLILEAENSKSEKNWKDFGRKEFWSKPFSLEISSLIEKTKKTEVVLWGKILLFEFESIHRDSHREFKKNIEREKGWELSHFKEIVGENIFLK